MTDLVHSASFFPKSAVQEFMKNKSVNLAFILEGILLQEIHTIDTKKIVGEEWTIIYTLEETWHATILQSENINRFLEDLAPDIQFIRQEI